MRWKPLLFAAGFVLAAAPAQAQFLGGPTILAPGPGVGVVAAPPAALVPGYGYGTGVVSSYSAFAAAGPVVVRPRTVWSTAAFGAPAVVSPVVRGPVLMTPGVTVVRPGWGVGPGFGPGPRHHRGGWGWRGW